MCKFIQSGTALDSETNHSILRWGCFYDELLKNLVIVKDMASKFEFSSSINDLVDWVQVNSTVHSDIFDHNFNLLSTESKELLIEVLMKYREQFELLCSDCTTYSDFWCLISFLQDLPLKTIALMLLWNNRY